MAEESKAVRGRPITNQVDQIPASPEDIAKALFRAADKKLKPVKKKPN